MQSQCSITENSVRAKTLSVTP